MQLYSTNTNSVLLDIDNNTISTIILNKDPFSKLFDYNLISREDGAKMIIDLQSAPNPVFSPDGTKILFTYFPFGYNNEEKEGYSDLIIFDLMSGKKEVLIHDNAPNANFQGSYWIDNFIVYSSDKNQHDKIYIYNYKDKTTKKLPREKSTKHMSLIFLLI